MIWTLLPAKVEINNYTDLKSLETASDPNQEHKSIILIGSDFYWHFITAKVMKEGSGLVAIESKRQQNFCDEVGLHDKNRQLEDGTAEILRNREDRNS